MVFREMPTKYFTVLRLSRETSVTDLIIIFKKILLLTDASSYANGCSLFTFGRSVSPAVEQDWAGHLEASNNM